MKITTRLGDIQPHPYRRAAPSNPVLAESMRQTGLWSGIQTSRASDGGLELALGSQRLATALEVFGPEHETAVELVPRRNVLEWALAQSAENEIRRNPVGALDEAVYVLVHWWDDVLFARYPTLDALIAAGVFPEELLKQWFKPRRRYAEQVASGLAFRTIVRILDSNFSKSDLRRAWMVTKPTARQQAAS